MVDSQNLSGQFGVQGKNHPEQDTLPLQDTLTHTHPHTDWDNVDKPMCLMDTSLGCGKKLELHVLPCLPCRLGENMQLHTYSDPGQKWYFLTLTLS